jgi:hypothetical protein
MLLHLTIATSTFQASIDDLDDAAMMRLDESLVAGMSCVVFDVFFLLKSFIRGRFPEFKRLRSLQNAKKTFAASRSVLKFRVLDLLECVPQRIGGEHLIVHIIGE